MIFQVSGDRSTPTSAMALAASHVECPQSGHCLPLWEQWDSEARDPQRADVGRTIGYFVIMRLADGGASPGAAGDMANVSHAFQPSGLFCAANSP